MKRSISAVLVSVFAGLLVWVLVPADDADAMMLRLAAHFRRFTSEQVCGVGAAVNALGGCILYNTTVFVPAPGVLSVTMYAANDGHGGAGHRYACRIDGTQCRPSLGVADGSPSGWVTLLKIPAHVNNGEITNCNDGGGGRGDCHDNGVSYSWCRFVPAGFHSVELRHASTLPPNLVFTEKAQFYVDHAISSLGSPASCSLGLPSPASASTTAQPSATK